MDKGGLPKPLIEAILPFMQQRPWLFDPPCRSWGVLSLDLSPDAVLSPSPYRVHVLPLPSVRHRVWHGLHSLTFGGNAQEMDWPIASEMVRSNDIGTYHTGDPDTFRRWLIKS